MTKHPVGAAMTIPHEGHAALRAARAWASLIDVDTLTPMATVTNPLWRVTGAGQAFVLKQLPQYPPGVAPVVEFRVLCHLQRGGVPLALPIITDIGTIYATVTERHWMLLPLLRHQSTNHELGLAAAAAAFNIGASIGLLNRALAECPWRVESFVDDPIVALDESLSALPAEVTTVVQSIRNDLRHACIDLPVQLTHGDCNDGNVLVDAGRVTGFIDLDHLPTGPRVRDLSYYLASRLQTHLGSPTTRTRDSTALVAALPRYIAGYHHAYPLSEHERSAVVPLMLIVAIGGAHWSLHGRARDLDSYRRTLDSITWMTTHFDELTTAAMRDPEPSHG